MIKTYFKSLESVENELGTKTYHTQNQERTTCQTLRDILTTGVIQPNTKHNSLRNRLCVSYITEAFNGSYRPEGILFQTAQNPAYCSPVDLMALTNGESFTSSDYDSEFLEDHQKLVFNSIDEMLNSYDSPEKAFKRLNETRVKAGLKAIEKPFSYNEVCFEEDVSMTPIGLVGSSPEISKAAEQYELPVFTTTQSYIKNALKEKQESHFFDFFRKSSVGALYRVGASFTIDALTIGLISGDLQSFCEDLDSLKLLRVAAYVVGINFVDYKFDVTNWLDQGTKNILDKIKT